MVDLTPSYADLMNRLTDIARLGIHKIKTTKLMSTKYDTTINTSTMKDTIMSQSNPVFSLRSYFRSALGLQQYLYLTVTNDLVTLGSKT